MNRPVFARIYPRLSHALERAGMAEHRRELLSGLTGNVLEVGAGDGMNFAHYPTAVSHLMAVEPEPHLRRIARTAADRAPVPIEVTDGHAEKLPSADSSIDAVVVSLVLCSVPDQHVALREIRRVLTPGGQLRFLEHVRADSPGMARVQRILDGTIWPFVAGGCHAGRDTTAAIEQAGFTITDRRDFLFQQAKTPLTYQVLGTAVRGD